MKKILMTFLLFVVTSDVFAIPMLTEASATGTTVKFATKLSEKLPTGYKVKIDLNNGKGLVAMTCSGLACSLSSNALPKLDSLTYKIGIYDAKGVLQGTTTDGNYVIVSTATEYAKISNSGAVLPDTARLGIGANDWACTKDNKTGLTWEVKTDDGGLRDKDWSYTWYEPDSSKNRGDEGYQNGNGISDICSGSDCDTYAYKNKVNKTKLCGAGNWRMPTVDELMTLVKCSDGKYDTNGSCTNYKPISKPTINRMYFLNTFSDAYWSSSSDADDISGAWYVYFGDGNPSYAVNKSDNYCVQLVH